MRRREFVAGLGAGVLPAAALAAAAGAVQAQPATPASGEDLLLTQRERDLAQKLRCLVCQNQTVADSNADLAKDLRRQVREQIGAGRSDAQILEFMTARYGDFVLYEPPLKNITLLLWLGPALLLGAGAFVAARVVRSRARAGADAPLADGDHARAQALLKGDAAPAAPPR